MSDLVFRTTSTDRTVFEAVVEAAEVHGWKRIAVEDPVTGSLTYKRLLLGAAVLGRKLMPLASEGKALGVMLPNANGAVVTILGVMSAGRVPAMINFTAGAANILAACKAAEVGTIVTSRAFVEKGKLDAVVAQLAQAVNIVYLEDVRATVSTGDKLRGLLGYKKPLVARKPDDPAAILFTSGSEGTPKGVVLSHRNMLANAAQAAARIDFGRHDKVFNVLPVFHSFGLTAGTILPLVSGVPIYLYPSPLHYRIVPELIYGTNATILFGTDTFLAGYARAAHPYDFRSLRYILAGAEPVRESTRRTYMEKFGLRILEGYGVTETAPVLALNTPMFNKFGTVGRLMPGMKPRLEPVPGVDEGGRLYVRGPNVMLGYLKADNPGVIEPPPEGWHDTGDIVTIDAQGFVTIKGRAKRFAKIGGEMISLAAVEMLAAQLWPDVLSAVATAPDARKGERLVLVTQKKGATRGEFQTFAKSKGASDLMVPAEVVVHRQGAGARHRQDRHGRRREAGEGARGGRAGGPDGGDGGGVTLTLVLRSPASQVLQRRSSAWADPARLSLDRRIQASLQFSSSALVKDRPAIAPGQSPQPVRRIVSGLRLVHPAQQIRRNAALTCLSSAGTAASPLAGGRVAARGRCDRRGRTWSRPCTLR